MIPAMVRHSRAAGAGCLLRALRAYALFILGSVGLAEAVGYWVASRHVARANEGWARETEPMESFAARFPVAPNSPAANTLDEMTRPLGIRMIFRRGDRAEEGPNAEALKALGTAISRIERPKPGTSPGIPPEAEAFLSRERGRLDAIILHILEGGSLVWEQDVSKGTGAPVPGLLGHRQLTSMLLGRAWLSARDGRVADAERALEASWRVNASYLERPDVLSQLIAVAVAQMQQGVLRATPSVAPVWLERMKERPFSGRFPVALQLEASNWTRYTRGYWGVFDVTYMEDGSVPPAGWGSVPRFLMTPYMRLSVAGISEALLRATHELAPQRRCDIDMKRYSKKFEDSIPRWNIIGRIATPSVVKIWTVLRETDLDRELTERVLLARAERGASGSWPASGGPSAVCEGLAWEYGLVGGGSLDIRPTSEPFRLDDPKWDWAVRLKP
jgi:hypothetical protein